MTDSTTYETLITSLFQATAPYAIYKWVESENQSTDLVKGDMDEKSLSLWLTQWNLHRSNPRNTRNKLMKCLMELQPRIMKAKKNDLAQIVEEGVDKLSHVTKTRQTSLMSKYAFSLRPALGAPYDRYALAGLRTLPGCTVENGDYPEYYREFNGFAAECGRALEEMGQTKALMPLWQPFMGKTVFKRRTADNSLMFLGGYVPAGNLDFWCKLQTNYQRRPESPASGLA